MSVVSFAYERVGMKMYIPDHGYENFVGKLQKTKTRKGKDYFISRITVPKEIVNEIDVGPDDYVFFKVKKAEWFHMLEWDKIASTWEMLPNDIKGKIIMDGLLPPMSELMIPDMLKDALGFSGATNPSGGFPVLEHNVTDASRVV